MTCFALLLLHPTSCLPARAADTGLEPGLVATFIALDTTTSPQTDHTTAEGIQLYVSAGQAPSPFLTPGRFQVTWRGYVSVDLRSEMVFRVEAKGHFEMSINDELVLQHEGEGNPSPLTDYIRLNKGTNTIAATLRSPESGDTWARLYWGEDETLLSPIPSQALSHPSTNPEWQLSRQRHAGRDLALEHRCFHCHQVEATPGLPELSMDAPAFLGIGARRRLDWMAAWIRDPRAMRSSARMPTLRHGPQAKEDAQAMAAFLASLTEAPNLEAQAKAKAQASKDDAGADRAAAYTLSRARELGKTVAPTWYERLHCEACHGPLGEKNDSPGILSLRHINDKFLPGQLEAFLRQPNAHFAWIRMPDFHLSTSEAKSLAASLRAAHPPVQEGSTPQDPARIKRGRELIQTSGCLNCHALPLENQFKARAWADLQAWDQGCLATEPTPGSPAPTFSLTASERNALVAFSATGSLALRHSVPSEFAQRQSRRLQCANCHGAFDGFPHWDGLGGKLKPEWMGALLAGHLPDKSRPWLPARMPAFATQAEELARGLAMSHGYPPVTPPEEPLDRSKAEVGHQLIGKDGGFSCVSCHAVGTQKATEVFEAEGINFQQVADRLQKDFYRRWILNPSSIDPQTKMPMYFDQGYSPLADVLEGSAERQIDALWEYFRSLNEEPGPPR